MKKRVSKQIVPYTITHSGARSRNVSDLMANKSIQDAMRKTHEAFILQSNTHTNRGNKQ